MKNFDPNGYLQPAEAISFDLDLFQEIFVYNQRRERLFSRYLEYLDELKQANLTTFRQWIDGSFVTTKLFPNDIDVVTFVDSSWHDAHTKEMMYWRRSYRKDVDAYFLKVFPMESPEYTIFTRADFLQWQSDFAHDRQKRRRGFVELNFVNYGN